jgi:hypothetical protein
MANHRWVKWNFDDFYNDVQVLTREEQSIWYDLLRLMHHSAEYGYLTVTGELKDFERLARMLKLDVKKTIEVLETLIRFKIIKFEPKFQNTEQLLQAEQLAIDKDAKDNSKTDLLNLKDLGIHNSEITHLSGKYWCKRLVEDEIERVRKAKLGAKYGKKGGGNPAFKKGKPNQYYSNFYEEEDLSEDKGTHIGNDIGRDIGNDIGGDKGQDIGQDIGAHIGRDIGVKSSEFREKKEKEKPSLKRVLNTSPRSKPELSLRENFWPSEKIRAENARLNELVADDATVERETKKFINRCRTDGTLSADWDASWLQWMCRAQEWATKHKSRSDEDASALAEMQARKAKRAAADNGHYPDGPSGPKPEKITDDLFTDCRVEENL